jgi:hypothetical protein
MGLQDSNAAPVLDDKASGTPQRFTWSSWQDHTIPQVRPDWPEPLLWTPPSAGLDQDSYLIPLDPAIDREVDERRWTQATGGVLEEPLEAHEDLIRLKIAGLLGMLCGRVGINAEDWQLSKVMFDSSKAVRERVQAKVSADREAEEKRVSYTQGRRAVHASNMVDADLFEQTGDKIIAILGNGRMAVREIGRSLSAKKQAVLQEVVADLIAKDVVDETFEPSERGSQKRFLELVKKDDSDD